MQRRHSSGSNIYSKEQKIKAAKTQEEKCKMSMKAKHISKKSSQDDLSTKSRISRGSSNRKLLAKTKSGSR